MSDERTRRLRELAERVVATALELGPVRAALLAGSAARGDADFFSDLDLLVYVADLPPPERLGELRAALGGTNEMPIGERTAFADGLQFDVDGIAVQVPYVTVAHQEETLEKLLVRLEDVHGPSQKILSGLVDGIPLHGEELIERWRARALDYPEALRRSMIEHHWGFFPLWWHRGYLRTRDAELWRLDVLLDAVFNLLRARRAQPCVLRALRAEAAAGTRGEADGRAAASRRPARVALPHRRRRRRRRARPPCRRGARARPRRAPRFGAAAAAPTRDVQATVGRPAGSELGSWP